MFAVLVVAAGCSVDGGVAGPASSIGLWHGMVMTVVRQRMGYPVLSAAQCAAFL